MQEEEFERELKVIVVGNRGVGKASLIRRFCKGDFSHEAKKTVGVEFLEKLCRVDEEDVRIMCCDTAGQEEFDAITRKYFRGAAAAVIMFSDQLSFSATQTWRDKVRAECGDIPAVLVHNKVDRLVDSAAINPQEVDDLARKLGLVGVYRTSVKDNVNVTEVFTHLASRHGKQPHQGGVGAAVQHGEAGEEAAAMEQPSESAGKQQLHGSSTADDHPKQPADVASMRPSKQRTGGKKQLVDQVQCSIS